MILEQIVDAKRRQLQVEKEAVPLRRMRLLAENQKRQCRDLAGQLCGPGISVIAEFKRASPSKGLICSDARPAAIAKQYEQCGAAAVSVLTEREFFRGFDQDLEKASRAVAVPILRKDFIIDPYQIYQARAIGADAVLLIAAILSGQQLRSYHLTARALGMQTLVEVHDRREAERAVDAGAVVIGINNRNLKTFEVRLETTAELRDLLPDNRIVVSESGIHCRRDMEYLQSCRVQAVLIGESLMRSGSVADKFHELLGEQSGERHG